MKHMLKIAVAFIFIAFSFSCNSSRRTLAVEDGWDLLGESKANFIRDRDEIPVLNGNRYTAIRFKVEKKDVHINDLHVTFQNGDRLAPVMSDAVAVGQYSRIIELGEGKNIRSVDFKYRSTGNIFKGRANILIFGRRETNYDYRRNEN